jgi:hypothetical protein
MARSSLPHRRRAAGRCRRAAWALAPALLLLSGVAHGAALDQYSVQVLAQSGVATPGFNPIGNYFGILRMNNQGQISLVTKTQESKGREVLGVLSNGQFAPIATAGGPSPDGKTWPVTMDLFRPWADINDSGDVAFTPYDASGNSLGVYFWDAAGQAAIPLAAPGTPATGDLVFASGGKYDIAGLNNRDEVAFVAPVKPASGPAHNGVFLRRADGHVDPVALPGDSLPGQAGNLKDTVGDVGLNDTSQVTFDAMGTAYRWENGTVSLLAGTGTEIPGLGKSAGYFDVGPNDQNSDVLLYTWTAAPQAITGLLLWQQGQLLPVLLKGQDLPGGGKFGAGPVDWNRPNTLGKYPFAASFTENGKIGSGAYLVGADGTLSLIARSGMTTPLGTLTRISPGNTTSDPTSGIGINDQGQVALTAQIDNGPDVLLLLTPKSPAVPQQTP